MSYMLAGGGKVGKEARDEGKRGLEHRCVWGLQHGAQRVVESADITALGPGLAPVVGTRVAGEMLCVAQHQCQQTFQSAVKGAVRRARPDVPGLHQRLQQGLADIVKDLALLGLPADVSHECRRQQAHNGAARGAQAAGFHQQTALHAPDTGTKQKKN